LPVAYRCGPRSRLARDVQRRGNAGAAPGSDIRPQPLGDEGHAVVHTCLPERPE
jgi:hypothetical protein